MTSVKKQNAMVVQSNNLVEAYYDSDLTATEHKIIRYAASKIKSNPDYFPTVSFDVKEFMRAGGLKGNGYHKKIETIGDELSRKRIKLQNDHKIGWFPWLSSLVYDNGTILLSFNTMIKDLLLELEGQFTKYNYQYIGDMRSGYSIRLYELLKQYAPIGKRRFDLHILKQMLGVDDKYKGYGQFKQRVLNQAKKELDYKGRLTFEFEEIKQGRQVKEIVFFIQVNEEQLSLDDFVPDEEETVFIEKVKALLERNQIYIKNDTVKNWKMYSYALIEQTIEDVRGQKMNYPGAYITKVLENKHAMFLQARQQVHAENDEIAEILLQFIERWKNNGLMPDWLIKDKLEKDLKSDFSITEIENIWNANKEHMVAAINE